MKRLSFHIRFSQLLIYHSSFLLVCDEWGSIWPVDETIAVLGQISRAYQGALG